MKTKFRLFFVVLIALACCLLTACNKVYYWEVAQGVENIAKIEIYENYGVENQSLLCEIASEYYEEIIKDIQAMPAHRYFGDPTHPFGKVIKIVFADGTYDEISEREPRHIIEPEYGYGHAKISWLFYNKAEYNQLIEKWLAKS